MSKRSDRELGMGRRIRRRDFLNGVAVGTAGAFLAPGRLFAETPATGTAEYYPPALTGLRGSHEGSFQAAHALRDASFWDHAGPVVETGETYDLVVVGGGISGLSAAHFYRAAAGPNARILVLDNHDDFGGHAKRNEFQSGGRTLVGYGGTQSIDSPAPYSAVAKGLIQDLGIDVRRNAAVTDWGIYTSRGLQRGFFFDKATFGADRLVPGFGERPWKDVLAQVPLSEQAKADLLRLHEARTDYLPGMTSAEKKAKLARVSYADFLTGIVKVDASLAPLFSVRTFGLYGVGVDAVPAQDAWGLGLPGFQGMNLEPGPGKGMNLDSIRNREAERYYFHFPDGNASVARLLVRRLVPAALAGRTMDDVVTGRLDYARLDEPSSPARIRLNSTAVRARHRGDPGSATELDVTYVRNGRLESVRAGACVLACWNTVIPHLCPEMPAKQREALAFAIKVPLVYTNVLLRNWTAFQKLGVSGVSAPGCYHPGMNLDFPVSLGDYRCSRTPEEPVLVHMSKSPCRPGLPVRDQHRAGRAELLGTSFETFEREIRDQLARILGAGGFDPARDVEAITVNRWPHGYAYQYNSLWDSFWLEGGEQPCVVGRQRFGRIGIANADAAAYSYTDAAIDQAHRAVQELLGRA